MPILSDYHSSSCAGLPGRCPSTPRSAEIQSLLHPRSLSLALFAQPQCLGFAPSSIPAAGSAEPCPKVLAPGCVQAPLTKAVARSRMCVPDSIPLRSALRRMCGCFRCPIIRLADWYLRVIVIFVKGTSFII